MLDRKKISIIIPLFNEELKIKENLIKLTDYLKSLSYEYELILVNDGSTDKTELIVIDFINKYNNSFIKFISYPENKGRGYALKEGFKLAEGDFLITTEADLSWGLEVIKHLVERLYEFDVVIASPYIKGGYLKNVPFTKRIFSKLVNKILTYKKYKGLTMITGMTRGYKREVLNSIFLESNDKMIHLELIDKIIKSSYRISEIPATITWNRTKNEYKYRSKLCKDKAIIKYLFMFSKLFFSYGKNII